MRKDIDASGSRDSLWEICDSLHKRRTAIERGRLAEHEAGEQHVSDGRGQSLSVEGRNSWEDYSR